MSNQIDNERLRDICKAGQGAACCKYIAAGREGLTCEKHTSMARVIEARTDMVARGDNCVGLLP